MFMKPWTSFDPSTGAARDAFEFWISLWPIAPLFGVEWRFGDTMAAFSPVQGTKATATAKAVRSPAKKAAPVKKVAVEAKEETPAPKATVAQTSPRPTRQNEAVAAPIEEQPKKIDDLTVIKGIGPGLARQLNDLGVFTLAQISAFSQEELTRIDESLSSFKGRCFRDDWIGQAKALIA